jgi:hypothetical protein
VSVDQIRDFFAPCPTGSVPTGGGYYVGVLAPNSLSDVMPYLRVVESDQGFQDGHSGWLVRAFVHPADTPARWNIFVSAGCLPTSG